MYIFGDCCQLSKINYIYCFKKLPYYLQRLALMWKKLRRTHTFNHVKNSRQFDYANWPQVCSCMGLASLQNLNLFATMWYDVVYICKHFHFLLANTRYLSLSLSLIQGHQNKACWELQSFCNPLCCCCWDLFAKKHITEKLAGNIYTTISQIDGTTNALTCHCQLR